MRSSLFAIICVSLLPLTCASAPGWISRLPAEGGSVPAGEPRELDGLWLRPSQSRYGDGNREAHSVGRETQRIEDGRYEKLHLYRELVDGREQIDVINVMPHFEDVLIGDTVLDEKTRQQNRQETLERYLAENGHDGMQAHALTGDPGTTICEYANRVQADTVVIPSHGYHGLDRLVLGSTAERVVRHCDAPVLVLRRHDAQ